MPKKNPLQTYQEMRDFAATPEPSGGKEKPHAKPTFVVQEHHARRLHYDFRLEVDGVLKSWAVPKGPSMDPKDKRLAVETEDHPLEYGQFEGTIPEGHYGAGRVEIWDRGVYRNLRNDLSMTEALDEGHLKFSLDGKRLKGAFALTRVRRGDEGGWLLVKMRDEAAAGKSATVRKSAANPRKTTAEKAARPTASGNSGPEFLHDLGDSARAVLVRTEQPEWVEPMLATLSHEVVSGRDWVFEPKLDGARCIAYRNGDEVRLMSRNRVLQNNAYPELVIALRNQPSRSFIVDGEIVAFENGVSSFTRLQHRMHVKDPRDALRKGIEIHYFLFDVLHADGYDTTVLPLTERKRLLSNLIRFEDPIRLSEHRADQGDTYLNAACRQGWEGLIAKRADSPYRSGRSGDWLKLKCVGEDEFVIGGYTEPKGTRQGLGALLIGFYEDGRLRYAGKVGTGFTVETLHQLVERLTPLERSTSPFVESIPTADAIHWVAPELVAQVAYSEVTEDGRLRHPRYLGLRNDLVAAQIRRPDYKALEI